MYVKLEKLTERLLAKLHPSNLVNTIFYLHVPSILTLRFRICEKFNFGRSYLLSDSHTNTVISDRFDIRQDGVENSDKAYWLSAKTNVSTSHA